jgi:MFS family permease
MDNHESSQPATGKARFYYGYIIALCAFISMVAIYLLPFSYGVYFKPMTLELGWSRTTVSGAFSLSQIISCIMSIALGWLIDRKGARIVLVICGVASGLGYFLLSQIDMVWQLFVVYGIIVGISVSSFAPIVSTVSKWFVQRRAMMVGIVISGCGVSTVIGPLVNTLLIAEYGWRLSYIIAGTIVAVTVIIVAQFMKREPHETKIAAHSEGNDNYQRTEKTDYSYSLREAIMTRQFWLFFLMSFCYAFCNMGITVHIVPHITDLGIVATTAAYVLATVGGVNIVGLIFMGYIGDRIGNKITVIIGFVLMALSMLMLLFIKDVWQFYLFAVIFGLATAGIAPQRGPMVAAMFGLKSHGLIYSTSESSFMLGAAVGPLLAGYIFDSTNNYLYAFLLSALIAILGLCLVISLRLQIIRKHSIQPTL